MKQRTRMKLEEKLEHQQQELLFQQKKNSRPKQNNPASA